MSKHTPEPKTVIKVTSRNHSKTAELIQKQDEIIQAMRKELEQIKTELRGTVGLYETEKEKQEEMQIELAQLRADKARLVEFVERTVCNFEGYWDDSSVEHLIYDGKELLTEIGGKK